MLGVLKKKMGLAICTASAIMFNQGLCAVKSFLHNSREAHFSEFLIRLKSSNSLVKDTTRLRLRQAQQILGLDSCILSLNKDVTNNLPSLPNNFNYSVLIKAQKAGFHTTVAANRDDFWTVKNLKNPIFQDILPLATTTQIRFLSRSIQHLILDWSQLLTSDNN